MSKQIAIRDKQYEVQAVSLMPDPLRGNLGAPIYGELRADVLAMQIGETHRIALDTKREVGLFRNAIQAVNPNNSASGSQRRLPAERKVCTTFRPRPSGDGFFLYYQVVVAD